MSINRGVYSDVYIKKIATIMYILMEKNSFSFTFTLLLHQSYFRFTKNYKKREREQCLLSYSVFHRRKNCRSFPQPTLSKLINHCLSLCIKWGCTRCPTPLWPFFALYVCLSQYHTLLSPPSSIRWYDPMNVQFLQ